MNEKVTMHVCLSGLALVQLSLHTAQAKPLQASAAAATTACIYPLQNQCVIGVF
jgi:hypothetical protein